MPKTCQQKIIWFTGLPAAGKTTLCNAVASRLRKCGLPATVLDADVLRKTICKDLGFTNQDRITNVTRIASLADTLAKSEIYVLVAAITPLQSMRDTLRRTLPNYVEVFVAAPLKICSQRDPKGLYELAKRGMITDFTGIDSPYEIPSTPDVVCSTDVETVGESTEKIIEFLRISTYQSERDGDSTVCDN